MAERYVHGFYTPDIFCALVIRASPIPMDDHDRRVIYTDMLRALTLFLADLDIGQAYSLSVLFHTKLSKLKVLSGMHPDLKNNDRAVVNTGRLDGIIQRLDGELFIYNQRVADGGKSDTVQP